MKNPAISRRIILLKDLISSLKETNLQLDLLATDIEKASADYYLETSNESSGEIQTEIDKYVNNDKN